MKVVIDIPNDFTGDYIVDKFKDFFSRVIADIDCNGMCGRYEKEIAEMFLKAFDDSEEKIFCNCQHNSNSRDNEPCCRCDSRHTNADRIRNMSDEELASVLFSGCIDSMDLEECPYASESELDNNKIRKICKKCTLEWLQSEAE
jgi:predicted metal-binding protein